MVQDYSINKCTRKCSLDDHALAPGEVYYSVILPKEDDLVRIDISAANWTEAPEESVGWWKCKMPPAGAKKLRPAPNGVLLDTLSELVERPGKEHLAYLLALLLVRRQVLSEEVNILQDDESEDAESDVQECWPLVCKADGRQWNVLVSEPDASTLREVQEELNELIFTEQ